MKKITSLFDFFIKVNLDKNYESVAMKAYRQHNHRYGDYIQSKLWIEEWANSRGCDTCQPMVDYLNKFIT